MFWWAKPVGIALGSLFLGTVILPSAHSLATSAYHRFVAGRGRLLVALKIFGNELVPFSSIQNPCSAVAQQTIDVIY